MKLKQKKFPCPTCKKPIVWSTENPFRPFCNERCKLIDLGAWADGKHFIPCDETPSSEDDSE